jgi:hypothetical protein
MPPAQKSCRVSRTIMKLNADFFSESLTEPVNVLMYEVTRRLTALYPEFVIFPSDDGDFDVESFAQEGHCQLELQSEPMPLIGHGWHGKESGIFRETQQALWKVNWEGATFDLLQMNWKDSSCSTTTCRWLIAPTQEAAGHFFATVCQWNTEIRGEVLVFSSGYWNKSTTLYDAIRNATFENLVLPGDLKRELQDDLRQFFDSRDVYERYRIPWKRGLLLVGPPGNGKTHTIKALLNWLNQPCLYVKSLKSRHYSDHDCLKSVFDRARKTTPCVLVMEDLDSLINDRNRSFFLNELDGFAANSGILLIATTNHPDRLDPAIVDRPSRFDRKYHFPLPALPERDAYIALWNTTLEPAVRLSESGKERIAAATDGFSFAYLKELFLSSMMRWVNAPQSGGMDEVMAGQCHLLREQMNSAATLATKANEEAATSTDTEDSDEDED